MSLLSEVLRVGGQASGIAGGTLQGYASDQASGAARVLAQAKADEASRRNAVLNALTNAQTAKALHENAAPVLGENGYASARGAVAGAEASARVPAVIDQAKLLGPIEVQKAQQMAPIHTAEAVATGRAMLPIDAQKAEQSAAATERHAAPIPVTQKDGSQVLVRRSDAVGQAPKATSTGGLAAPMAAKVGQFGEMLKKAHDLLPAMEALDVSLAQSGAQDVAANGLQVPLLGVHIPGTKGMGSAVVNKSPAYATYQAALVPFVLAAAHTAGGARISQEQIDQIRHSVEIQPGESAESRAQKRANLIDMLNSYGGALPSSAIAEQEGQMGQGYLDQVVGAGYRQRGGGGPVAGGPSGPPAGVPSFEEWLKHHGH